MQRFMGCKESDMTERLNLTELKTLLGLLTEQKTEQSQLAADRPEPEGSNRDSREASSTKLQAGFFANQDFLGFWMVDIHREGRSQRSAPQKRHLAHLRRRARCTPRKPSGWFGGADKMHPPTGGGCARQAPGHLSCSDLGRTRNAGPTEFTPLWNP